MKNTPRHQRIAPYIHMEKAKSIGILEFEVDGEWRNFEVVKMPKVLIFGGCCNVGFLQSGFIVRESFESLDETLQELLEDLETYYTDGPEYTSRIWTNKRM